MIYLRFTESIPNTLTVNSKSLYRGAVSVQLGDEVFTGRSANRFNSSGLPSSLSLVKQRAKDADPISAYFQEAAADTKYLSVEADKVQSYLKKIKVSIVLLEEYENPFNRTYNSNTGQYEPETRMRPFSELNNTITTELGPLNPEFNGYDIHIYLDNNQIAIAITPALILLDNPKLALTQAEKSQLSIEEMINHTVETCTNTKYLFSVEQQVKNGKSALGLMIVRRSTEQQAYILAELEKRLYQAHSKAKSPNASKTPVKTFIAPDYTDAKGELIRSLGGIVLSSSQGNNAKIQIQTDLLKKEIREQLGLDRLRLTYPDNILKRLNYLEQNCDATIESEGMNKFLVTFPKKHLALVEKVTKHWDEIRLDQEINNFNNFNI